MVKKINKKENQLTPKKIRIKIIGQVQKFQKLSRTIKFSIPISANLKTLINGSSSLKKIGWMTNEIVGKWNRDDLDLEKWMKLVEKLRKTYVRLIFNTGFITDEEIQQKLDEIPLALAEIIKEYENK